MTAHFESSIAQTDPLIAAALNRERARQSDYIELIASENIVSRAVLDALGHEMTNKTLEGYPGARFHGGGACVDVAEQAAIDRAKDLFDCGYVNVQPHSGSQANLAVFFALLSPGDRVLSLDLAAGGHLSHGLTANLSGRWFDARHYGVQRESGLIDYDEVEAKALEIKPKLLITGGSAYPREIDFVRLAKIAREQQAQQRKLKQEAAEQQRLKQMAEAEIKRAEADAAGSTADTDQVADNAGGPRSGFPGRFPRPGFQGLRA